jgi:hypothetical protein
MNFKGRIFQMIFCHQLRNAKMHFCSPFTCSFSLFPIPWEFAQP